MVSDFGELIGDTAEASLWLLHGDASRFTFTPAGGTAAPLDAIIGPEEVVESREEFGRAIGYKRSVTVAVAALASPQTNATCTVDGVSYSVAAIRRSSGANWELDLVRSAAAEVSRNDYRRGGR